MPFDDASLKRIMDAAVKAAKEDLIDPRKVDPHADAYHLRQADGALQRIPYADPPVKVALLTLADFIKAAKSNFARAAAKDAPPLVLCGDGLVLTRLGTGQDDLRLCLKTSDSFAELNRLEARSRTDDAPEGMMQADFIRYLRVKLHGCVARPDIEKFRALKIMRHSDAVVTAQHGRESLAAGTKREILNERTGGDLPDELIVTTPVYDTDAAALPVRCFVDIDLDDAEFKLIPMQGELLKARQQADAAIVDTLRAALGEAWLILNGSYVAGK